MSLLKRKRKQSQLKHSYRGIPTHVCPCGSQLFKVACIFEDGEIILWFTDAECALCGAELTAPTPLDIVGTPRSNWGSYFRVLLLKDK